MNYLYFLLQKNKENYGLFLIYTVLIIAFTSIFGMTLGSVSYEKESRKLLVGMEECYHFLPYSDITRDGEYLEKIRGIEKRYSFFFDSGVVMLPEVTSEKGDILLASSEQFSFHIQWNLIEGKGFTTDENEVIVINNAFHYQVGDTIIVEEGEVKCECKVVGLLNYPVFLLDNSGAWLSYEENDDFDSNPPYSFLVGNYEKNTNQGSLFLNPRSSLLKNKEWNNINYIFPSEHSAKSQMLKELGEYGDVESIKDMQTYKLSFLDRDESILEICLLFIFICGLIVHNFFSMMAKQREYGIYYMIGISWKKLIGILALQNIFSFLIGFIIGCSFVYRAAVRMKTMNIIFIWNNQLALLAGIVIIYVISIFPMLYHLRKIEPIDLIVRKE